jgi:hypothetical protein
LKKNYKKDSRLFVWAGDHLLGKAPQALTGPDGQPLIIQFSNVFSNPSRETMSFLIPHEKQSEVVQSKARFKVIRAGRRSGKTAIEIELMVFKAVSGKDRNVFFL